MQGLYHFRQQPATHCFVRMINSALHNKKPYAVPIQCVPYATMKESDMKRLVRNIVKEMTTKSMKVAYNLSFMCMHLSMKTFFCRISQRW